MAQNRYLELAGSDVRVDLRSYERQGLDIIPTVHMGPAVTEMERKGITTNIGNLNRDIKAANRLMDSIRKTIASLQEWISAIRQAQKEAVAEMETPRSPALADLLNSYLDLRKEERRDWSGYGKQKGTADDLKTVSQALIYLKSHDLVTLDDLDTALQELDEKAKPINAKIRKAEKRMQDITGIQKAVATCKTHKEVYDKYVRIGWKSRQAAFAESHKGELDSYNKAYRYLKKQGVDMDIDLKALQAEYDSLKSSHAELSDQLAAVKGELKPMKDIRYWVGKVLSPEQEKAESKPEPKQSPTGQIAYLQEQQKQEDRKKAQKQKKQDMER